MSYGPIVQITVSAFNTLKTIRGLIAATSEDDVQAQAVLAAEQLGACIQVAPERIEQAVDTLAGQTSIRVQNLVASIGIHSGGLVRMMQQSTPLIQFFVLCAACKTTLLDEECSKLVFEMLKTSNLLSNLPCSGSQLLRLISSFSGQAAMIAPAEEMHEIASAIDEFNHAFLRSGREFQSMEFPKLANLLMAIFEHIRDDTVESIVLEGNQNSIWLSSTLLWLLGNRAFLLIGDKVIKGNPGGKLCIVIAIEADCTLSWSLKAFKAKHDILSFISETTKDINKSLSQIPLRLSKSFLKQYYWNFFANEKDRKEVMTVCGEVAQTLILVIAQRGRLRLTCDGCEPISNHCMQVYLSSITQTSWFAIQEHLLQSYGWEEDDETRFDSKLLADILKFIDTKYKEVVHREEFAEILTICKEFVRTRCRQRDRPLEDLFSNIIEPALYVSADAAVTCTAFFVTGSRYIKPLDEEAVESASSIVGTLLTTGLEVRDFRRYAFNLLLPGSNTWHNDDLAICRDGYVAGMDILWTESISQSDALRIRVQGGKIRKDNFTFDSIREILCIESNKIQGRRLRAFDAVDGLVVPGEAWKHTFHNKSYTFETSASLDGTRIEIKHYMIFQMDGFKAPFTRRASWIDAIEVLATAEHMDLESRLTADLSRTLMLRLKNECLAKDICWTDNFGRYINQGSGTLLRAGPDIKKKIFGAAASRILRHTEESGCLYVIIRHRSSMLQCIEKAVGRNARTWVIVD
ncbi:hypothetical protein MMC10_004432 [Thelotrema lepadinum]|nr:hypothetical protein [Thelotrema lepadinum]